MNSDSLTSGEFKVDICSVFTAQADEGGCQLLFYDLPTCCGCFVIFQGHRDCKDLRYWHMLHPLKAKIRVNLHSVRGGESYPKVTPQTGPLSTWCPCPCTHWHDITQWKDCFDHRLTCTTFFLDLHTHVHHKHLTALSPLGHKWTTIQTTIA